MRVAGVCSPCLSPLGCSVVFLCVCVRARACTEDASANALTSASRLPGLAGTSQGPVPPSAPSTLQFVTLAGLIVQFATGVGVSGTGITSVTLAGLTVSNHGQNALALDGSDVTVSAAVVFGTGCAAVGVRSP